MKIQRGLIVLLFFWGVGENEGDYKVLLTLKMIQLNLCMRSRAYVLNLILFMSIINELIIYIMKDNA